MTHGVEIFSLRFTDRRQPKFGGLFDEQMFCRNIFDLGAWHSEEDIGCEDWNFNFDCLLDYSRCCSSSEFILFLHQTKASWLVRYHLWLLFDDNF